MIIIHDKNICTIDNSHNNPSSKIRIHNKQTYDLWKTSLLKFKLPFFQTTKQRWFSGKWQKLAILERLWKVRVTIYYWRFITIFHWNMMFQKLVNDLLNSLWSIMFFFGYPLSYRKLRGTCHLENHHRTIRWKKNIIQTSAFSLHLLLSLSRCRRLKLGTNGGFFTVEKW